MTIFRIGDSPVPRGGFAWTPIRAFSLIEVIFAIAVVSFAVISLLGLMGYLMQTLKKTDQYTRLSNVSSQVLAQFASQPYTVSTNCVGTNRVYYFTYEGLPTNSASAYFQCNVTNTTPTNPNSSIYHLTNNFTQIEITISWPATKPTSTNVIVTSCLNYD